MIFVNTNLAAASGAVLAMIVSWIKFGKPEIGMSLNGALAGLAAITSPCATVTPGSAIIIGCRCWYHCCLSVLFFDKIRVDDPVGAIQSTVSAVPGVRWQLVFSTLARTSAKIIGVQLLAISPPASWASGIMFKLISKTSAARNAGRRARRA